MRPRDATEVDPLAVPLLTSYSSCFFLTLNQSKYHEVQCSVNEIYNVKKELEKKITNFISTEIEWIPLNSVEISKEKNENLINFFEALEEEDDVQNIYSNAEFTK